MIREHRRDRCHALCLEALALIVLLVVVVVVVLDPVGYSHMIEDDEEDEADEDKAE